MIDPKKLLDTLERTFIVSQEGKILIDGFKDAAEAHEFATMLNKQFKLQKLGLKTLIEFEKVD